MPKRRWMAKPSTALGCNFRSRLEVRWACLLETIGWTWQYEPYVVKVSKRKHYLCDFLVTLPSGNKFWLEIKPKAPTKGEIRKALGQVQVTQLSLAFGIGSPMHGATVEWVDPAHTPVSTNPFSVVTHRTLREAAILYDSLEF